MNITIKYKTDEPNDGLADLITNLLEYEGYWIAEYNVIERGMSVTIEITYKAAYN